MNMKRIVTLVATFATLLVAEGRDTAIYKGKLTSPMNANGMMITNLPPEFWEGHGGGIDTNAVNAILSSSNLVSAVALSSATNAVSLDLGRAIATRTSTNDVCNIVTNDVSGFTPWTTGNYYHSQHLNVTNIGIRYVNGFWEMHLMGSSLDGTFDYWVRCAEDQNSFYTDPNATFVREYYIFGTGLTSTRTAIPPRNALGLAYLRDVPSTNGFVTAAITNDVLMKSGGVMGDYAVINFNGGADTVGYDGIYFSSNMLEWSDGFISTYGTTVTLDEYTSVSVGQWSSISSSSTGDTLPQYLSGSTVTNGGAKAYADATFAPRLTGVTYDFAHGSNFTLRLYATLTNLIDRLGGSITNAPVFN